MGDAPVFTLRELGISKHLSSRSQRLAAIPEAEFEAMLAKAKDDGKELTRAVLLGRKEQPAAPTCPTCGHRLKASRRGARNTKKAKGLKDADGGPVRGFYGRTPRRSQFGYENRLGTGKNRFQAQSLD